MPSYPLFFRYFFSFIVFFTIIFLPSISFASVWIDNGTKYYWSNSSESSVSSGDNVKIVSPNQKITFGAFLNTGFNLEVDGFSNGYSEIIGTSSKNFNVHSASRTTSYNHYIKSQNSSNLIRLKQIDNRDGYYNTKSGKKDCKIVGSIPVSGKTVYCFHAQVEAVCTHPDNPSTIPQGKSYTKNIAGGSIDYTCQSNWTFSEKLTCNTAIGYEQSEDGNSCVQTIVNCPEGNIEGYSYSEINDSSSKTVEKTITDGTKKKKYQANILCDNGDVTIKENSEILKEIYIWKGEFSKCMPVEKSENNLIWKKLRTRNSCIKVNYADDYSEFSSNLTNKNTSHSDNITAIYEKVLGRNNVTSGDSGFDYWTGNDNNLTNVNALIETFLQVDIQEGRIESNETTGVENDFCSTNTPPENFVNCDESEISDSKINVDIVKGGGYENPNWQSWGERINNSKICNTEYEEINFKVGSDKKMFYCELPKIDLTIIEGTDDSKDNNNNSGNYSFYKYK